MPKKVQPTEKKMESELTEAQIDEIKSIARDMVEVRGGEIKIAPTADGTMLVKWRSRDWRTSYIPEFRRKEITKSGSLVCVIEAMCAGAKEATEGTEK